MGSLFSPKLPPVVQAPAPAPPPVMPDTNAAPVQEARRKQNVAAMQRGGRSSTILTAPENRGAVAPSYSSTRLGTAS